MKIQMYIVVSSYEKNLLKGNYNGLCYIKIKINMMYFGRVLKILKYRK